MVCFFPFWTSADPCCLPALLLFSVQIGVTGPFPIFMQTGGEGLSFPTLLWMLSEAKTASFCCAVSRWRLEYIFICGSKPLILRNSVCNLFEPGPLHSWAKGELPSRQQCQLKIPLLPALLTLPTAQANQNTDKYVSQ